MAGKERLEWLYKVAEKFYKEGSLPEMEDKFDKEIAIFTYDDLIEFAVGFHENVSSPLREYPQTSASSANTNVVKLDKNGRLIYNHVPPKQILKSVYKDDNGNSIVVPTDPDESDYFCVTYLTDAEEVDQTIISADSAWEAEDVFLKEFKSVGIHKILRVEESEKTGSEKDTKGLYIVKFHESEFPIIIDSKKVSPTNHVDNIRKAQGFSVDYFRTLYNHIQETTMPF